MYFRHRIAVMLLSLAANGCTLAHTVPPAKPIPDDEPQVTQQLGLWLHQLESGSMGDAPLTDKARAALQASEGVQAAALLRRCGQAGPLQLLARSVFGEDRRYRYRLACQGTPLLVDLALNKAAKIDVLQVSEE